MLLRDASSHGAFMGAPWAEPEAQRLKRQWSLRTGGEKCASDELRAISSDRDQAISSIGTTLNTQRSTVRNLIESTPGAIT